MNSQQTEKASVRRLHCEADAGTGPIIGCSRKFADTMDLVRRVAPTNATVLVSGETGTGKELAARALHHLSGRRNAPFVTVNCASVPRELFESEFFGHVKGSFTGAIRNRTGRFEQAHGGTLFLDEVSEIPLDQQGKLLRVLQEHEIERVGDEKSRAVDVRIIAATNRDLESEVANGCFREDLYFRLNVVPLSMPPLRERADDIVLLAGHFLAQASAERQQESYTLSAADRMALREHTWPGNVRELRNLIERAVALSRQELIPLHNLVAIKAHPKPSLERCSYLTENEFRDAERRNVMAALDVAGWKIAGESGAARLLGIPPSTLTNRMRSLGISRPPGEVAALTSSAPTSRGNGFDND